jgi:hypothetical protein
MTCKEKCKECIHCEICREDKMLTAFDENQEALCKAFKPKSRFVELPCEVGQTIYRVGKGKVWEWEIAVIEIYQDEIALVDDSDNYIKPEEIGKTVFLSREEAENALKEREKE